ncbi:MAG: YkyB family protein [Bacillus sp. (in: firmicutes)]
MIENKVTVKEHELSQAIFIVNKHAKAAPMPKVLYDLKKSAIQKMLKEGKAQKIGLHFSNNPKNAKQQSDVIVQCGEYFFHLPPSKEDIKTLPHLGSRDTNKRNPKTHMSLSRAKAIIHSYIGSHSYNPKTYSSHQGQSYFQQNNKRTSNIFTSSFLGKDFLK